MAEQVKKPIKITETILRDAVFDCNKNAYRFHASYFREDGQGWLPFR